MTYETVPNPSRERVSRGNGEFYFLAAYLFILFSRILDVFLAGYKIPSFALFATCLVAVVGGQILRSFKSRVTVLWLLFTLLVTFSAFFSIWRGGSISWLINTWSRALVVYFLVVALAQNIDQCARAIRTIGWAVGTLTVITLFTGSGESGRVFLEGGKLSNPNDLAQVLLLGLPCLWLIFTRSPALSPGRILILPILVILIVTLIRTGSRGAMIAVFVMLMFFLMTSASKGKAMVLVMGLVLVGAMTLAVSQPLRTRYLTLFDADADDAGSQQASKMSETAAASAASRRQLLQESLALTLSHPVLGVGPDMFAEARERNAHQEHRFAVNLQTHNSYSQVSSECGIPAVVLFIAIVVYTFRTAKRVHARCKNLPGAQMQIAAAVARTLCFTTLAYAVTSFFISVAYQILLPALSGLAVALEFAVAKELAARAAVPVPAGKGAGTPAETRPAPVAAVPVARHSGRLLGRSSR